MKVSSGDQQMNVVNESGVFALILTSRKPQAKKFRRWVMGEVLPAIRRTGRYEAPRAALDQDAVRTGIRDGAPAVPTLDPSTLPLTVADYMVLKGIKPETAREEATAHEAALLRDLSNAGRARETMRHPATGAWLISRQALDIWWADSQHRLLAMSAHRWSSPADTDTTDGSGGVTQDTVPMTLADFLVLNGIDDFSAPSIASQHEAHLVGALAVEGDERGTCLAPLGRSRVFARRVLRRWWEKNRVQLLSGPRVGLV